MGQKIEYLPQESTLKAFDVVFFSRHWWNFVFIISVLEPKVCCTNVADIIKRHFLLFVLSSSALTGVIWKIKQRRCLNSEFLWSVDESLRRQTTVCFPVDCGDAQTLETIKGVCSPLIRPPFKVVIFNRSSRLAIPSSCFSPPFPPLLPHMTHFPSASLLGEAAERLILTPGVTFFS